MKKEHKSFVFFSFYDTIEYGDIMKYIRKVFYFIIAISIISLFINGYMIRSASNKLKNNGNSDYIVVLGASVKSGKPSLMLRDRLDKAIELYTGENKIVVTGDHQNDDYDEVTIMKNYLLEHDVLEDNIITDEYGISTYDSIYRLKNKLDIDKCIIVTQKYHLYRSIYISNKLGIEVIGVPAEDIKYRGQKLRDIREFLARVKDFFKVMFKPKSKYI